MRKTHALAFALLLSHGAPNAAAAGTPKAQDPSCGLRPNDWCPVPPGDPCGTHADEKACRADSRCQGLPYRGESVIACMPDGKGFWTNCPAVGCVSRFDPPRQPPRRDVVEGLCSNKGFGGEGAAIHVWRTAREETTVLELRANRPPGRPPTLYYDAGGRQLLVVPFRRAGGGSDLDKHFDELRSKILAGLTEAETIPCGRRR